MSESDDVEVSGLAERRWRIPSFLVRDYHFGYERECHDLLFGGDDRRGARDAQGETVVITLAVAGADVD